MGKATVPTSATSNSRLKPVYLRGATASSLGYGGGRHGGKATPSTEIYRLTPIHTNPLNHVLRSGRSNGSALEREAAL